MPRATGIDLDVNDNRLTPPDNDARHGPINVAFQSVLHVEVRYEKGMPRDLTLDSRVSYTVDEEECAEIVHLGNVQPAVRIKDSAACMWVTVKAAFLSFTHSVTVPVVVVKDMWVNFAGYPSGHGNDNVAITELGLVQCTNDTYHHATARAYIQLSDHAPGQRRYQVTWASTFESNDIAVAHIQSRNRVFVKGPGIVMITATFGATPTTASASLVVVDNVIAFATTLTLSTSLQGGRTVRRMVDTSQPTAVAIRFDNGLTLPDIAKSDWVDVESVVAFSSNAIDTIGIDSIGSITLYNNAHSLTTLRAQLACDSSIAVSLMVAANLDPAPFDVDFGRVNEWQFEPSGSSLAIGVRIQAPVGEQLINFQVLCEFDLDFLTSEGATFAEAAWSGVQETLNDPPSSFQLVGSDKKSQRKGTVNVGTVTLRVEKAGVTLITGNIIEIMTVDAAGGITRVESAPVFAGQGYVSISTSARRGLLTALPGEHLIQHAAPRRVAEARRSRQRALQSCEDPCDAQRVWGDVTADCKFTSADVLEMSSLASQMEDYLQGIALNHPLEDKCPWVQRQAHARGVPAMSPTSTTHC